MSMPIGSPAGTLLSTVASCVCAKLRDAGRPVCTCCLTHGGDVLPMFGCDCDCDEEDATGRMTARVLRIAPAPSNTLDATSSCLAALVQVTLQIGVFRCIDIPEADEEPSCDSLTAEALGFLADEQIMRAAVACCPDVKNIPGKWQLSPGEWEPHGPSGGCAGGVLSLNAFGTITFPKTTKG
jgi:hypothetical protein